MGMSVRLLSSFFVVVVTFCAALTLAVDPGEDFAGYMENLEERRQAEERHREKLHAHEVRA